MIPPVTTLRFEERTRLAVIIEMSLKLAGERDPGLLLKDASQMAWQIMQAPYASMHILIEDGQTISGRVFSSETDAAAVIRAIPALGPGLLANMQMERRTFRLHGVTPENLGFDLLPGDYYFASVLGVPPSDSPRVQGRLFFVNKLDADEFSDQDEQVAGALASQVTLAYERMEEPRHADEEMGNSGEVLEAMFESAPDAIAAVSEHGRIVKVNAQTQNFFGFTRDELVGQLVEILVPERFRAAHPARRQQCSSHARRWPMGKGLELFCGRKDGSEFSVDIMLRPLKAKRGKLMLSVVRDATARKQNEERIQQLNRSMEKYVEELQTANQDLETFSYSASHDLHAPLRQVDKSSSAVRATKLKLLNGEISVNVEHESNYAIKIEFGIADNGRRIPPQRTSRMFDGGLDHETTMLGGSELSLMLERHLARMMGGDLWAEDPQIGAVFHFTVNLRPAPTVDFLRLFNAGAEARSDRRPLKILLADDSADTLLLIRAFLKDAPWGIESADNGRTAFGDGRE